MTDPSVETRGLTTSEFEALFVRLEKPLYNVAFRWVWNRDDARDLVQEAFVRLWRMRERVLVRTVKPLVYRMTLNLAVSYRRRRRLRPTWGPDQGTSRPDEAMAREQSAHRVRAALELLTEAQREVVVLCELGELSYAEVAEVLQIKPGTVGSRRNAAFKRLRRLLDNEDGHGDDARD